VAEALADSWPTAGRLSSNCCLTCWWDQIHYLYRNISSWSPHTAPLKLLLICPSACKLEIILMACSDPLPIDIVITSKYNVYQNKLVYPYWKSNTTGYGCQHNSVVPQHTLTILKRQSWVLIKPQKCDKILRRWDTTTTNKIYRFSQPWKQRSKVEPLYFTW